MQKSAAASPDAVPQTQAASGGLTLWPKLAYGFGAVAYGVNDQGFAYFLLLFYSQVIGLDRNAAS